MRANFNVVAGAFGKNIVFLNRIFCKVYGTPIAPRDEHCGKCDHEFSYENKVEAMAKQAELRDKNKRNAKYKPPKAYI